MKRLKVEFEILIEDGEITGEQINEFVSYASRRFKSNPVLDLSELVRGAEVWMGGMCVTGPIEESEEEEE